MEEINIALTGHRPNKLFGYNLYSPGNVAIAMKLREHLLSHLRNGKRVHAISGMALGGDTLFALVVLKLKREGYDITLEAAIPCANHASQWPKASQEQWQAIVNQSDKVTYVSNQQYRPYLMQKRNEYMVDQLANDEDELIALYDNSPGGTANCVNYGAMKGVNIVQINPKELLIPVKGDILKDTSLDICFHQANCFSTMGSGIAKQIANMYPTVYAADANANMSPKEKLGHYTSATVFNGVKNMEVVNLYGQFRYGRDQQHTNYDALRSALFSYLKNKGSLYGLKLGVPYGMGCGRGGGDWNEVKSILKEATKRFHTIIYMYEI